MFSGIAGGASASMKYELDCFFSEFGFKAFEHGSDIMNIVSAGIGDGDGVVMIMGTGNCAISQYKGVQHRVSGWGYLFDDGGSGYSIARDAFAAHFRYIDGSGGFTSFSDSLTVKYQNPQTLLGELYQGGKKFIASFCPLVFEHAYKGDNVCLEIIKRNMAFAANVIYTAAKQVKSDEVRVVLAGGLSKDKLAMDCLAESLPKERSYNIQILDELPVQGALKLAKKQYDRLGGN